MKAVAILPARYASTRFPGKPLLRETGRFLIQHVYEAVASARGVTETIVATDDRRIVEAVRSFGGRAEMTRADHPSGTDRVAECAAALGLAGDDLVLNVQGDEPELEASHLEALIERMRRATDCRMGTLACPFPADGPCEGPGSPADPNCVKVVMDAQGLALYFSRSLVPYPRGTQGRVEDPTRWLLHIGVYAFRNECLQRFAELGRDGARGGLEDVECLEQLRALEGGRDAGVGPIAVAIVDRAAVGIDAPADYAAFVARWRAGQSGGSHSPA